MAERTCPELWLAGRNGDGGPPGSLPLLLGPLALQTPCRKALGLLTTRLSSQDQNEKSTSGSEKNNPGDQQNSDPGGNSGGSPGGNPWIELLNKMFEILLKWLFPWPK